MLPHLLFFLSSLSSMGFDVTVAETFRDAREALLTRRQQLLLTDIRLGAYNGLHLVLRGQARWPEMRSIVTSETPDVVLQAEAERLGATFIQTPVGREELQAAIYRTLFSVRDPGLWQEAVRPPFERRRVERRTAARQVTFDRRVTGRRRDASDRISELMRAARPR